MAATVTQRLWAHGTVRFGVLVLGFMCLIALIAPLLGTVDPAAMDSNHINKAAGKSGDFALLDGSTVSTKQLQGKVLQALFKNHVYEEVAYEIYDLQNQVRILSRKTEVDSRDLTLQEVAKKLNQSYTTVYRWVHGDKCRSKNPILKARRTGRTYRVSLEVLEKFREKYTF